MKLEEGKWYKWYQKNHDSTHTGKYFNCPDEGFVEMKPWIVRSIQYSKEGTFDSKYMQDIVEITDLTEISKLLPDEHEDKVDKIAKPKFIVGKWYKNLNYSKDWFAKAISDSRMSGDNFYHGDYITDSKVFGEQSVSISNLRWNEDTVECPLSEIQQYLPDGHVDKVAPKSERYLVTMKFFYELKEPERSQAIENYDENRYGIPSSLGNALSTGFTWGNSKQGYKYWNDIRDSIENNTYFKELEPEVLVFGKYKIGDIVVSLIDYSSDIKKGGLFIVTKESTKHLLIESNDWRLSTPEEVEAYNNGIINIADIKPTSLEGRYIKCLKENDWNNGKTKVGDVLKIRKSDSVGDLFIGYNCLDNSRLRDGEFELLPIDYTPEPVKEEQTMFKKGDYIVTLINDGDCGKINYCSKQNEDIEYLCPEIDTKGIKNNGNATFKFSDKSGFKWRFATKEEGEEYERHGKPYNVTNLLSSSIPKKPTSYIAKVGDYVEVIDVSRNCFKLGQMVLCIDENHFKDTHGTVQFLSPISYRAISNTTSNNPFGLANIMLSMTSNTKINRDEYGNTHAYPLTPKEAYPNYSLPVPTNIILKTKTKSKSIKL